VTHNLVDAIGTDTQLRRVASTNGGEYAGACPFCGGVDRFRVWPNQDGGRWWCRQCERSGDLVAYLVETGRLDKRAAYRARHGDQGTAQKAHRSRQSAAMPTPATPPLPAWQERAWGFVAQTQADLWAKKGMRALSWLRKRGLTDGTIRHAGLGYNPHDFREGRPIWGLADDLWRVNIRRPVAAGEEPKWVGPAGFSNGLYNADELRADRPAMLVEGEIDAMTVQQVAGDLVSAVATGGTGGSRRARWMARLALCSVVLVSFDADDAGDQVRSWWLETLGNGKYWRPYFGDANAMLQAGADVRSWAAAGLASVNYNSHKR